MKLEWSNVMFVACCIGMLAVFFGMKRATFAQVSESQKLLVQASMALSKDPKTAVDKCDAVLQNPSLSQREQMEAYLTRGRAYLKLEQRSQAERDLDKALALLEQARTRDASNVLWPMWQGIILRDLGKYDEALTAFREGLKVSPGNSDVEYEIRHTEAMKQ